MTVGDAKAQAQAQAEDDEMAERKDVIALQLYREREMEKKRTLVGVQNQRPTKRSLKKKRKKGLLSYLKWESYMYAPLISRSSSTVYRFPQTFPISPDKGVKAREGIEENEGRMNGKFGEYLKSDSYMYSPIVDGEDNTDTASGPMCQIQRVTVAFSTMKRSIEANRLTKRSENLLVESQQSEDNLPGISLGGHSFAQRERVKQMAYKSCRSFSVTAGKQRLSTEFRKVIFD